MQSFYVTLVLFMFGQIGQSCKLRSLGTIELSNRRRVCGASFITDKSLVANTLEWIGVATRRISMKLVRCLETFIRAVRYHARRGPCSVELRPTPPQILMLLTSSYSVDADDGWTSSSLVSGREFDLTYLTWRRRR